MGIDAGVTPAHICASTRANDLKKPTRAIPVIYPRWFQQRHRFMHWWLFAPGPSLWLETIEKHWFSPLFSIDPITASIPLMPLCASGSGI